MTNNLRVSVSGTPPPTRRGPRALWPVSGALLAVALTALASPAAAQRAPAPAPMNLPPDVVSLACAPTLAFEAPPTPLRVTGSQDPILHRTVAPGDLITINAGTDNGIEVGQQYYTRRPIPMERRRVGRDNPVTILTSGWIRIYAVDTRMSLATITHACDAIALNDYLEPFVLPTVPVPSGDRPMAQRSNYGRVGTGVDNRTTFGTGDYLVVDRGSDHGVTLGTHFVVYRDKRLPGNFLFELGEAVAVDVRPESSTLRVTIARDAFVTGDWVAMRK